MNLWKEYHLASSIKDAISVLATAPGESRLIAGGTDLLLDLMQGRQSPVQTLIDVTHIPELCVLESPQDDVFIGAGLPLKKIITSPPVFTHGQALVEACSLIGGPQVRNTATLGGNVAHALPAGDGTIALLSLGAVAEVASSYGIRSVPLLDLYLGPGKSALDPGNDLLVGFRFSKALPGEASCFRRVMRPQGVAIAILNMSIWLRRSNDAIQDIRIALGPAGPVPKRATSTENLLRGCRLEKSIISEAKREILSEVNFRTSPHRATCEYRSYLCGVLLEETLETAWQRANQQG